MKQPFFYYTYPNTLGFKVGFTTRFKGGGFNLGLNTQQSTQEVLENREFLAKILKQPYQNLVFAKQEHTDNILEVEKGGEYPAVDGFITQKQGIVLNILTADCLGILAYDPDTKIMGAFHAGWKGSAKKIVQKGLKSMIDIGAKAENIKVFINPGICKNCYEVKEDLKDFFKAEIFSYQNNKMYLDLIKENTQQILECGVLKNHITTHLECTYTSNALYSFRKEKEKAGHFSNFIFME